MSNVKMLNVYLDRVWSGHKAGEIVTVEDYTAESMVRKGYGQIVVPRMPRVETADAPPAAETAVVNPVLRTKDKAVIDAQIHGEADLAKKTKGKNK